MNRKTIKEIEAQGTILSLKTTQGPGHAMAPRKPIMGLGMSDHQRAYQEDEIEATDDEKIDDEKVKVSRVFRIREADIRKIIRSVIDGKRLS